MSETVLAPPSTLPLPTVTAATWRRWLVAFFCYNSTMSLLFTSAIWVIYLAAHGYSPFTIGLMEMTFHIAKFVAEVPAGIFADLLGRRKSLIVYSVLGSVEKLAYLVPSPPLLFLSFVVSGVSYAFLGGANESVLWTLVGHSTAGDAEKQTARYGKLFSVLLMLSMVSEVSGTALGGYLGSIMQTLPFICQIVVNLVAIIPLMLLPRSIVEARREQHAQQNPIVHLGRGLHAIWQSPALLGFICIAGLTECCAATVYFYTQLQLHGLGFALSSVGIIMALSTGSQFAFTALTPYLMRRIPTRLLIAGCVFLQIGGLVLMIVPNVVLSLFGFLVLFQAASAISYPTISTRINEICPEEQRTTILSFQTGLFSLSMIVLFPLFGLGLTRLSYSTVYSWLVLGLSLGCGLIVLAVWWRARYLKARSL